MLTEEQFQLLLKHIPANSNKRQKTLLIENGDFLQLKKGTVLIDELKANHKSYVIINGSCVRYIITPDGEEKASSFHTESFLSIIGNQVINTDNSIVNYEIKLNETSDVIALNPAKFTEELFNNKEFLKSARSVGMEFLAIQNQLHNHLIGLTKEDFLKWLLENYGFLFQRFTAKDIASFMGVSPTWLSLLKKKLATRNL